MKTILIVDDEPSVVASFRLILKDSHKVIGANSGKEALSLLEKERVDLMLLDLIMPEMDGMELLKKLQISYEEIGVLVVTAVKDVKSIVKAVKLGALDYIIKPFEVEDIKISVEKALKFKSLTTEVRYLRSEFSRGYAIGKLIYGQSRAMEDVIDTVLRVSKVDSTVLIRGESGTGKELVARAIHYNSERRENPFVVVSCPNLTGELLESELFGHEKGSFTGAYERRLGKFEVAECGTLFLDEISEISLSVQAKLLRVLQEKELSHLGNHSVIKTDVRIIAATNKDLEALVRDGRFREDLYYRINVVPIYLPPLRERPEDIPQLVEHFFNIFRKECHAKTKFISRETMEALGEYRWPGNIRELKNVMERTIALYSNEPILLPEFLPKELSSNSFNLQRTNSHSNEQVSLEEEVVRLEKRLIKLALNETGGVKSKAAELLGTTRRILNYKMQKYRINGGI